MSLASWYPYYKFIPTKEYRRVALQVWLGYAWLTDHSMDEKDGQDWMAMRHWLHNEDHRLRALCEKHAMRREIKCKRRRRKDELRRLEIAQRHLDKIKRY